LTGRRATRKPPSRPSNFPRTQSHRVGRASSSLNSKKAPRQVFNAKLVIARLDQLSRDVHFLLGLEQAGVEFIAVAISSIFRS
jgi:hypothetical protein